VRSCVSAVCVAGLNAHDESAVVAWCKANDVSLVVIGPENLLAEGLCDSLTDAGLSSLSFSYWNSLRASFSFLTDR